MADLEGAIDGYLTYLHVERGLSPATIRAYRSDLADFSVSRGAAGQPRRSRAVAEQGVRRVIAARLADLALSGSLGGVDDSLRIRARTARAEIASGALRGATLRELVRSIPLGDRDA